MRKLWSSSLLGLVALLLMGVLAVPEQSHLLAQDTQSLAGKKIYFSEEFGEVSRFDRSLSGISRFAGMLSLSGAELHTIEWRRGIPADADLVVIAGPSKPVASEAEARLWAYLENGGKLLIFADALLDTPRPVMSQNTGFFDLTWTDLGIRALDQVVLVEGAMHHVEFTVTDREGNTTQVSGEEPAVTAEFTTNIINTQHPITQGLSVGTPSDAEVRQRQQLLFLWRAAPGDQLRPAKLHRAFNQRGPEQHLR